MSDFPGRRGWGYDGVLPFAPESSYGRPETLKTLVEACHARGLAVFLDVVYNHFGPEGNYLHRYAPAFFSRAHKTLWGDALNFDEPGCEVVRSFVVHNALYWLEEFHLDGLRLDAVHAIADSSAPHVLGELARAVAEGPGRDRLVHLVLENDGNESRYLARAGEDKRPLYQAQWNDDLHHALHTVLTGERDGYYADYQPPLPHLARALGEGFAFQGEWSPYRGRVRGESSAALPPTAFVGFLQNHDQIGNRAFGDRLESIADPRAIEAALTVTLLAPMTPMLFMGEEWGSKAPFPFFCDFKGELAEAVRKGRHREYAWAYAKYGNEIPDPLAESTFRSAILDWESRNDAAGKKRLALVRELLAIRRREIVPRLAGASFGDAHAADNGLLTAHWRMGDGATLQLAANLSNSEIAPKAIAASGTPIWGGESGGLMPRWSVFWRIGGR